MTPKFHFAMHLGLFARRYGMLPACFVHERKHKCVKRFENDYKSMAGKPEFGHNVLRCVISFQTGVLNQQSSDAFVRTIGLVDPKPPSKNLLNRWRDLLGAIAGIVLGLEKMHQLGAKDPRAQAKFFLLMTELHYRYIIGLERLHIGRLTLARPMLPLQDQVLASG